VCKRKKNVVVHFKDTRFAGEKKNKIKTNIGFPTHEPFVGVPILCVLAAVRIGIILSGRIRDYVLRQ